MGLMDKFADPQLFEALSFGDKMIGSTVTMLMGMGITFIVLILLWGFVAIMGKMVTKAEKGDKASEQTKAAATPSAAAPVAKPAAAPAPAAPAAASDDALIAVITAAIAAYQGGGVQAGNLVVRKISRISGESTAWSNAAKGDCIESRKF